MGLLCVWTHSFDEKGSRETKKKKLSLLAVCITRSVSGVRACDQVGFYGDKKRKRALYCSVHHQLSKRTFLEMEFISPLPFLQTSLFSFFFLNIVSFVFFLF